MTDNRKLLELAALAAGIRYNGFDEDRGCDIWWLPDQSRYDKWNPLEDDGDALRLAVRLRIEVEPWIHGDSACARAACEDVLIDEPHYGDDPERATRLAIVRVAAEIGRRMENKNSGR